MTEVLADVSLPGATDLFQFANGDAGWVMRTDGVIEIARLRPCAN